MTYNYKILDFDPQQGIITIQFEGYEAYAFNAPYINGNYLSGQELENYIQTLYPQVLPYENRVSLIESISGKEALLALVEPPTPYIETTTPIVPEIPALIVAVVPTKSTYYIGETIEAIIRFNKPVGMTTFVNVMLNIPGSGTMYMPSEFKALPVSPIRPFKYTGANGETLEMYLGDTTAKYTGPVYQGGISYTQATISAKTMLNQKDIMPCVISTPIQLISDPIPNISVPIQLISESAPNA